MKAIFVRHTSVAVERGVCYGQTDVPLADTFLSEAENVIKRLREIDPDGKHVYTSPLQRCVMLASICGYSDAIQDARLKEMNFGEWEMQRYDDIKDPRLQEWYDDYFHVCATGGESFEDQQERLRSFILSLKENDIEECLIFTHGGIIMQAMLLAGVYNEDEIFNHQPSYGDVCVLYL